MKPYQLGVVVGRFQVDELHKAHKALIDKAFDECAHVLVFVGTTVVRDSKKNPLDFLTRFQMLRNEYRNEFISILPIADMADSKAWDATLDDKIKEYAMGQVRLYSGRGGFHTGYAGAYRVAVTVIDEINDVAGTDIRAQLGKTILRTSDFRKGVIFANMNKYPKVHPTVDIAVLKKGNPDSEYYTHVALGKKPGEIAWRFPGGFADPTDANFNAAAKREAREELGANLEIGHPEYLSNVKIDDWRYRNEEDKIITSFFKADYAWGYVEAGDDLEKADFIELDNLFINIENNEKPMVLAGHVTLLKILFENLIKNGQYIPPSRYSERKAT